MNLHRFTDPSRSDLQNPFSFDGMTCASNGHILIALEKSETEFDPAKKSTELIRELFHIARKATTQEMVWIAASNVQFDADRKCSICSGSGSCGAPLICEVCAGEGAIDCDHCGQTTECRTCAGEGVIFTGKVGPCANCCATGVRRTTPTTLGTHDSFDPVGYRVAQGKTIDALFLAMIRQEIPDAEFAERPVDDRFVFRFMGGFGLVAPLYMSAFQVPP